MSEDPRVTIILEALDNASKTMQDASNKISQGLGQIENKNQSLATSNKQVETSTKDLALGLNNATTALFGIYSAVDRVENAELTLHKANLTVSSSFNSMEDAKRRLNLAYASGDEEKVSAATADLNLASERYTLALERQAEAENNKNKTMISAALQVIPSTITAVDSLSRAWKNFPSMHSILTTLNSDVSTVGSTAKIAALGVGAFVGGFTIGYTALSAFGDAIGPVGRALAVLIPTLIAASIAIWAVYIAATAGVGAIPMVAAMGALAAGGVAVGAAVYNQQSYGNVMGQGTKINSGTSMASQPSNYTYSGSGSSPNQESTAPTFAVGTGANQNRNVLLNPVTGLPIGQQYVPAWAEGAVVSKPTLAVVGEGGETEYVLPDSKLRGIMQETNSGAVIINFNAPVYGMDDFEQKVGKIADRYVMTKLRRRM